MNTVAAQLFARAAERRKVGWEISDVMTPGDLEATAREITRLEDEITRLKADEKFVREEECDAAFKRYEL